MELGIRGKAALVVGASRSIGRAVAVELAAEGCRVAVTARDAQALYDLGRELGDCYVAPADLMEPARLDDLVATVGRDFGVPEIIVHAVGGSCGVKDARATSGDYAKVWRLNLGIAVDINRAFLPAMVSRGWGRVVHVSSHATTRHIGYVPYTSAKHALEGYVRNLGRELAASGVVVSAIRPGPFFVPGRYLYSQGEAWTKAYQANYCPAGRWGEPEEAARVIAFLCGAGASYMPGAIVDVDGAGR